MENKKLVAYIKESTSILSEVKSMNETSESQVKNLTNELEKSLGESAC